VLKTPVMTSHVACELLLCVPMKWQGKVLFGVCVSVCLCVCVSAHNNEKTTDQKSL